MDIPQKIMVTSAIVILVTTSLVGLLGDDFDHKRRVALTIPWALSVTVFIADIIFMVWWY